MPHGPGMMTQQIPQIQPQPGLEDHDGNTTPKSYGKTKKNENVLKSQEIPASNPNRKTSVPGNPYSIQSPLGSQEHNRDKSRPTGAQNGSNQNSRAQMRSRNQLIQQTSSMTNNLPQNKT